jgi:hypothetical protein
VAVKQKHQAQVDRINQRAAEERQKLTSHVEVLQGKVNIQQGKLGSATERLVQRSAELEAKSVELVELQQARMADNNAWCTMNTDNQATQQYLKRQNKVRKQLEGETTEALAFQVGLVRWLREVGAAMHVTTHSRG